MEEVLNSVKASIKNYDAENVTVATVDGDIRLISRQLAFDATGLRILADAIGKKGTVAFGRSGPNCRMIIKN